MNKKIREAEKDNEKIISLKKNEYLFDLNSLFLPFIPDYDTSKGLVTELEVPLDDGSVIKVTSPSYGVPTLYDKDVLLALQRIMLKQNTNLQRKFKIKKSIDDLLESDRTIGPISIESIAKEMGYEREPSVDTKYKICTSIKRMHEASYITTKSRIYVKKHDTFLMKAEEGIHLIDNYNIIEYTKEEKDQRAKKATKKATDEKYLKKKNSLFNGYIKMVINSTTFKSIILDQYVFYNWDEAREIKNITARHIYLLALKMAGANKEWSVSTSKLLKYLPMKPGMQLKYQKQAIKRALTKLNSTKKCKISYWNNDVNHFSFSTTKKETIAAPNYMKDKFNSFGEMIEGFIDLGLTREEAINLNLQKIAYYQALLRYVTIINSYGEIEDTRAYILKCLKNERPVPAEYYN